MENLSNIENNKESFNDQPVVYCKNCLSLAIRVLTTNVDYCDKCGSTDTEETDITRWEQLYEERYNKKFLTNK
jgi:predicted nucleic-acid-binding Zn-ribbon protein